MRAAYYKSLDGEVLCKLCPKGCQIAQGTSGLCGVRVNNAGTLHAESYGKVTSLALDPIEKKPLYHFYPKTMILSVGSYGCNFRCDFCQNYQISMEHPETETIMPGELVETADILKERGNIGIAYTYNEPLVGFEYVLDCARLAHKRSLKNVLVTNGFIETKPLKELLPFIDAMNIDLKSAYNSFYNKLGGNFEKVLDSIRLATAYCHVEVTTLVIPGENSSTKEIEDLAKAIASIDDAIPYHITRFFPRYKMHNYQPTPVETIKTLVEEAKKHLCHVYLGNCGV